VRTGFRDAPSWEAVQAQIAEQTPEGFRANVGILDDPAFAGLVVEEILAAIPTDYPYGFLVIVDDEALGRPGHPVLVVDLRDAARGSFRALPSTVAEIEGNLSLSNMDFAEFASSVDGSGVFRGFGGPGTTGTAAPPTPPPRRSDDLPDRLVVTVTCCDNRTVLRLHAEFGEGGTQLSQETGDLDRSPDQSRADRLDASGSVGIDCPRCGRHDLVNVAAVTPVVQLYRQHCRGLVRPTLLPTVEAFLRDVQDQSRTPGQEPPERLDS
jgi:hypothetical protein